jgi:hypothetical protein
LQKGSQVQGLPTRDYQQQRKGNFIKDFDSGFFIRHNWVAAASTGKITSGSFFASVH